MLKKFPKHGETQAMKALVLNCLERKEEVRGRVIVGRGDRFELIRTPDPLCVYTHISTNACRRTTW